VLRNRPHNPRQGGYFGAFFQITVLTLAALALGWFHLAGRAECLPRQPLESETELAIWSHIVTISAGFVLLVSPGSSGAAPAAATPT
jgi:hypothetical protein